MSNYSPLIIKFIFVFSLLFVSTSAQLFWGLPGDEQPQEQNQKSKDKKQKDNNNNEDEQQGGFGLSGLPGLPGLPHFGGPGGGGLIPGFGGGSEEDNGGNNESEKPSKNKGKKEKPLKNKGKKEKPSKNKGKKEKPSKNKGKKDDKKEKHDKEYSTMPIEDQGGQEEQNEKAYNTMPIEKGQENPNNGNKQEPPMQGGQENPNNGNKQEPPVQQGQQPVQQGQQPVQQGQGGEIEETNNAGKWEVVSLNSGVSAMHLQLMPSNKLLVFDATSLGKSSIELPPNRCRLVPNTTNQFDCFAHSIEYDPATNNVRTLKVETNPWCSSGGLRPDGTFVSTGGWEEGEKSLRYYASCDTCDWRESKLKIADVRWYSTQVMLADGRFVIAGGRRAFTYEFVAPENQPSPGKIDLPFLFETTDLHENNLYPFLHLAPDGNVFMLANNRAILLDVRNNKIVRKYPDLPGGARNYPGSGSAAILPINLQNGNGADIEILVCGGGQPLAFGKAEKEGIFLPALDTCGKIKVLDPAANWEIEKMPGPRVMSDMLILPNGQFLLLNGAKKGSSGWQFADEPNFTPYLYSPKKPNGQRFRVLAPSPIPRMYHSTSAVLPEGKILVAGSNTNPGYQFRNVKFPTELRVEKYSPPYLDPALEKFRPKTVKLLTTKVGYGQSFQLTCTITEQVQQINVMVNMYRPPFTTHSYSMDQRLLNLKITSFTAQGNGNFLYQVEAPPRAELAPPGYYLIFVNYRGVPSTGSWIQLH